MSDVVNTPVSKLFEEANRQLAVCNACRYCEGFCPAFKTLEKRRSFDQGDILYLANLCHDCRACYNACMYTPPHEFAVNFPKLMAEVRVHSYQRWSWPGTLGRGFKEIGVANRLGFIAAFMVLVCAATAIPASRLFGLNVGPGAFYRLVSYEVMVATALLLTFYGLAIWLRGALMSWSEMKESSVPSTAITLSAIIKGLRDAFILKHLDGGGPGCPYPGEISGSVRRVYHSFVFWGFLSALVSTTLAFIYQDFLHRLPPYDVLSAPVVLGSIGGIAMLIGVAGLSWIKRKSNREPSSQKSYGMDYAFLITLGVVALSGMLTLLFRETRLLGTMLILHLASVAALFITAPYGKFVHMVYRTLALVRYHLEQASVTKVGHP